MLSVEVNTEKRERAREFIGLNILASLIRTKSNSGRRDETRGARCSFGRMSSVISGFSRKLYAEFRLVILSVRSSVSLTWRRRKCKNYWVLWETKIMQPRCSCPDYNNENKPNILLPRIFESYLQTLKGILTYFFPNKNKDCFIYVFETVLTLPRLSRPTQPATRVVAVNE